MLSTVNLFTVTNSSRVRCFLALSFRALAEFRIAERRRERNREDTNRHHTAPGNFLDSLRPLASSIPRPLSVSRVAQSPLVDIDHWKKSRPVNLLLGYQAFLHAGL
jgi:hypothetical protein